MKNRTTEPMSISLKKPLKRTVEELALAEDRTPSNMAAVLIGEAIKNRGIKSEAHI